MHGTRQPILGFASINYMNKEYQMRDRIKFLARSVTSNISRYQGHEFFVEFFLYPFALELAQENAGKPGFQFRPDKIDQNEFNLVVEMYRRLAKRMPDAYYLEDTPISVFDPPGKVVGWHNMENKSRYQTTGGANLFETVIDEALDEKHIS
jgi:hypothetical protein